VTYAICGSFAGVQEIERTYVSPASIWYSNKDYAFVDVTIDGATARLVFRDPDYNELESFLIQNN
jgi:hypothetical protein